jgi:hypothetical protein
MIVKKRKWQTEENSNVIVPTIGRVIWVFARHVGADHGHTTSPGEQPEAALISYVHDDRTINVGGFGHDGMPFAIHNLPLVQEGDVIPLGRYATWMPYQQAQAARGEKIEALLAQPTEATNPPSND